jgi:hypothetical protein
MEQIRMNRFLDLHPSDRDHHRKSVPGKFRHFSGGIMRALNMCLSILHLACYMLCGVRFEDSCLKL